MQELETYNKKLAYHNLTNNPKLSSTIQWLLGLGLNFCLNTWLSGCKDDPNYACFNQNVCIKHFFHKKFGQEDTVDKSGRKHLPYFPSNWEPEEKDNIIEVALFCFEEQLKALLDGNKQHHNSNLSDCQQEC